MYPFTGLSEKCPSAESWARAYATGTLDPEFAARHAAHFSDCIACKAKTSMASLLAPYNGEEEQPIKLTREIPTVTFVVNGWPVVVGYDTTFPHTPWYFYSPVTNSCIYGATWREARKGFCENLLFVAEEPQYLPPNWRNLAPAHLRTTMQDFADDVVFATDKQYHNAIRALPGN